MKSFTLAESWSQLAAERATNCATAQGRATWREIQPLVQPDPPDLAERIEAKIAAMLAMPATEPEPKKPALAQWEADAADKFLTMNDQHQATASTRL